MATHVQVEEGAVCWADLWTSNVGGNRHFYAALFGWTALEPSEEFGGYFMFTRAGVGVAGCMGDMGDARANDAWKIYFATSDAQATARAAEHAGATVSLEPMAVADLGVQAVLEDPTGAVFGLWQPGTFSGFVALGEHGAPSWFELAARDHRRAAEFYAGLFGLDAEPGGGGEDGHYTVLRAADGTARVGITDVSAAAGTRSGAEGAWSVYWEVESVDAAASVATALGGTILMPPVDTAYGRIATLTDVSGAVVKVRSELA